MRKYTPADLAAARLPFRSLTGDKTIRVACVGDSITAGMPQSNYPAFLQEYLTELGKKDGYTYLVKNHGTGGAAVHHVIEPFGDLNWGWRTVIDDDNDGKAYFYYDDIAYRSAMEYTPDVTIIQFGTNDGPTGNLDKVDGYFKADYYEYLIKPFLDKGSFVVLATPPHAHNGIHDFGVNGKISDLVREIAKERDLPLIDINEATEGRNDAFPDGLHGNDSGYSLLAQTYFARVFGGERIMVTVKSAPGAMVSYGIHAGYTNENGEVCFTLPAFEEGRKVAVRCVADGWKSVSGEATVTADAVYEFPLTERQVDLAVGCKAVSDSEVDRNTADKAVNGDRKTRWESAMKDDCSLTVDLGSKKRFNAVNICWEAAYASHYTVDVSDDGTTYRTVAEEHISRGGLAVTDFAETEARFVRIHCITRGTGWGNSIYELQILTDKK